MADPLAICIEDLEGASGSPRYVRCVAVPGRQAGLALSSRGELLWKSKHPDGCELWVSGDEQLILYRLECAPPVLVTRAGRSLDAPVGKPVVLRDRDEVTVGVRRLRVHVHGRAERVHEPAPLTGSRAPTALKLAAVVAMTAAVTGCKEIEVRDHPPEVAAIPADAQPRPSASVPVKPAATAETDADAPPIDVRETPPMR